MSKSKNNNVINPLDIIEKYGADALRMALIVGATPGKDISIGEDKIRAYRNFANKLWNITRFILLNSEGKTIKKKYSPQLKGLTKKDEAFIQKLNTLINRTTKHFENHKYSLAGEKLYAFIWHTLADKYIEESKDRLQNGDEAVLAVLMHSLKICLKLLHPFMPFVTEAIWQELPEKKEALIVSSWPKV